MLGVDGLFSLVLGVEC